MDGITKGALVVGLLLLGALVLTPGKPPPATVREDRPAAQAPTATVPAPESVVARTPTPTRADVLRLSAMFPDVPEMETTRSAFGPLPTLRLTSGNAEYVLTVRKGELMFGTPAEALDRVRGEVLTRNVASVVSDKAIKLGKYTGRALVIDVSSPWRGRMFMRSWLLEGDVYSAVVSWAIPPDEAVATRFLDSITASPAPPSDSLGLPQAAAGAPVPPGAGAPASAPDSLPVLDQSKPVRVNGYTRKDGTVVRPYTRAK